MHERLEPYVDTSGTLSRVPGGLFAGVPEPQYHNHAAYNRGFLATFNRCPQKARWEREEKEEDDQTQAMGVGTAIHKAVLEDADGPGFHVGECEDTLGDGSACTNPAKYLVDGQWVCGVHGDEEDATRKTALKPGDDELVESAAEALLNTPASAQYLADLDLREVVAMFRWRGLQFRARIDGVNLLDDGVQLVEVKSVRDASPDAIERKLIRDDDWMQDPFYTTAWNMAVHGDEDLQVQEFVYVCVEKEPPYVVQPYGYPHGHRKNMQLHTQKLMNRLRFAIEEDMWPNGYVGDVVGTLDLPRWAQERIGLTDSLQQQREGTDG